MGLNSRRVYGEGGKQREKLKERAEKRAWRFERRLEEERGELARKCLEEMKKRVTKGKKISGWEKKEKLSSKAGR